MNVKEIVAAVDVGQSTVSAHLKVLAEVRFLLADHKGTATYYRINDVCVDCFPTAADIVMRKPCLSGLPHRTEVRSDAVTADRHSPASEPIVSR
jgi:DNA-binding transcriptional ArsR family regulator